MFLLVLSNSWFCDNAVREIVYKPSPVVLKKQFVIRRYSQWCLWYCFWSCRQYITHTRYSISYIRYMMYPASNSIENPLMCLLGIVLTHWGRVTHICVSKLTNIGSDNGLSPGRRQAIIWTNTAILVIGPLGTNFSELLAGIQAFSFKKCIWTCCLRNGVHFVSASMC